MTTLRGAVAVALRETLEKSRGGRLDPNASPMLRSARAWKIDAPLKFAELAGSIERNAPFFGPMRDPEPATPEPELEDCSSRIAKALANRAGQTMSLPELALFAGCAECTVRQVVRALRKEGMPVECVRGLGYRLG